MTTAYSYDRADRITAAGAVAYSVDAAGNLVARGADAFGYDQANRLKSATVAGSTTTYGYDGDGVRVARTQNAQTTSYVHDRAGKLPVVIDDGVRRYVQGPSGLAYSLDASGAATSYHADALRSTRALSDAAAALTQRYLRDAWGSPTLSQGSSTQPFGFTGELSDSTTGFLHLRARDYDPATGRFLQRDTVLGSLRASMTLNRYVYAADNPVSTRDPSGRCFGPAIVVLGGCIGALTATAVYLVTTPESKRTLEGAVAAAAGGFVAGTIAQYAAPLSIAVGSGTTTAAGATTATLAGTALVTGAASTIGYTVQTALDPSIDWSLGGAAVAFGLGFGSAGMAAAIDAGVGAMAGGASTDVAALVRSAAAGGFADLVTGIGISPQLQVGADTSPPDATPISIDAGTFITPF